MNPPIAKRLLVETLVCGSFALLSFAVGVAKGFVPIFPCLRENDAKFGEDAMAAVLTS
jgi:hypothetical protein